MEKHFVTGRSESVCKEFIKVKSKKKRRVKKGGKWWLENDVFFLFGILARFASALKLDFLLKKYEEKKWKGSE